MKRVLWPTLWLIVVALLAAGLSAISKLPVWWAFLIVAGALLINGCMAILEDDLPSGFNNPDGTHTPRYSVVTAWVIRGLGIVFALLCFAAIGVYLFAAR